jgi:dipeptidyl aminopeptidase/acylaminoacyl peptidase
MLKYLILPLLMLGIATIGHAEPRLMQLADAGNLRELSEPQISPDGQWVAYKVTLSDSAKDKLLTDLWISKTQGGQQLRLTFSGDVSGQPRWNPQGQWLSFLATRGGDEASRKGAQVWRLNLAGGEAEALTDIKGGVADYAWSPDGKRMVLVVADPDPRDEPEQMPGWKRKTLPPIVIDRFLFKHDRDGYLGPQQSHLHVFDVATAKAQQLTEGQYSEKAPSWSPDGRQLVFLSQRKGQADRSEETSLYVMDALPGAAARLLASFTTEDGASPAWSPDGSRIAFLAGDEVKYSAYQRYRPAVVASAGGPVQLLAEGLDRGFQASLAWAADGRGLYGIVDDDRISYLAYVPLAGTKVERLTDGRRTLADLSMASDGSIAMLGGNAKQAPEVELFKAGRLQRLSHQNDDWFAGIQLGRTEDFSSTSADGTEVHGLITLPPAYQAGRRYPTILFIHGGPNGQDSHSLRADFPMRELLSAQGYVVLQVNYRGSSGRGQAFQRAIYADWGNKELQDLLGAVDWAVKQGYADPQRLAVGGWSYGGILTNYLIASDKRFKAAVSGAGSSNQLSMFGTDQYAVQYEREVGPPWLAQELWIKLSYPFFKADRIQTPTLFLGGQQDFNVPIAGSEQMYQALKMLDVDTQLVIYPGQFHRLSTPSYRRDVEARFIAWFGKYLKP